MPTCRAQMSNFSLSIRKQQLGYKNIAYTKCSQQARKTKTLRQWRSAFWYLTLENGFEPRQKTLRLGVSPEEEGLRV